MFESLLASIGLSPTGLSLMVNMGVSLGTIMLALFTWKLAKTSNVQAELIRRQAEIHHASSNPFLEVKDIKFVKNRVSFKLKNAGNGDAYSIGVYSNFSTSRLKINDYLMKNDKLHASVEWGFEPKTLFDNFKGQKNRICENGWVAYPERSGYYNTVLKSSEMVKFDIIPKYFIHYREKKRYFDRKDGPYGRRIDKFEDLTKIMTDNGIDFVNLELTIVCKNSLGEITEYLPLSNFVIDVKKHKSLQDAFESGYHESFRLLGSREIDCLGGQDYRFYSLKPYRKDQCMNY